MSALRGKTGRDTARLEAFSDGVIAIAITLLILEVRVPARDALADGSLWQALGDHWPNCVGFLLSFVTIGILWANHHTIFRYIGRADHYLVLINTLFLLSVSVLPFTTALLAEYLGHDGQRTATIVYTGWFLLVALSFNLLWVHPRRAGLIAADADPRAVADITRRFRLGPPSYILAFAVSFVRPALALVIAAALALLYLLPKRSSPSRTRRRRGRPPCLPAPPCSSRPRL
ncbi:MAG: TMEM175 family protein [Thermomicrobiales bacterium]